MMEYNFHNGPVRSQISTSMRVKLENCFIDRSSNRFRDIHTSKFADLEHVSEGSGAIRWQVSDFLSNGNCSVCSIAHRLRDILQSRTIPNTLTLKVKSRYRSRKTELTPFH